MVRVAVGVWIGNAAAVLSGGWGAVTRRAHQTGLSRTSRDHHAQRVAPAVGKAPAVGGSDEARWAAKKRLRAENEARWEAWVAAEQLPEAQQQACAATGSAMGWSLGQILLLLALVLPQGSVPSRATVGRWVAQASRHAGGVWAVRDPCCQRGVLVRCVEEIFFPREPMVMAVEPQSRAGMAGPRGPERSG